MNNHHTSTSKLALSWLTFLLVTIVILWFAHALAFFPHEYSHSFTAWFLGWKTNPVALNYGNLAISNLLLQFQIDENVDYAPIFASGHNWQAGLIALAGLFIGNLLFTYPLSRWGFRYAKQRGLRTLGLFFYWFCVASVGNLIDYVPVRTFAASGDMFTLEKGFNCSPWLIIVLLGVPFAIILVHFFVSFAPKALHWLLPDSVGKRALTIILTAFAVFGFYGAAGWSQKDPVSHYISVFSVYALIPITIVLSFWLTDRFWVKNTNGK